MKTNVNTKIIGRNVVLYPYREHHVPRYHQWMQLEDLRILTASQPLTLEEEYEMQISWREDNDKCTFIILDKIIYENEKNDQAAMIGDTNIFIVDRENLIGEIEIMIAEVKSQGKKYGWESVIMMLLYGIKFIDIKTYIAKISFSNHKSLKMFNKLGFVEKSSSKVFQEKTLEKVVELEWVDWLEKQVEWEIQQCEDNK